VAQHPISSPLSKAEGSLEDVNKVHTGNMYAGMLPKGVKDFQKIIMTQTLTHVVCYLLSGIHNTDIMVVRNLLDKALKEAYPTLNLDCTLTDKEGNTL
jgi:hypothetical protein